MMDLQARTPLLDRILSGIIRAADSWTRLPVDANRDQQYRSRALFVIFGVVGICTIAVAVSSQFSSFKGTIAYLSSTLGFLGVMGGYLLLRYTDSPRKAGAYFVSALVLALSLPMPAFGGINSPAAILIVITPIGWGLLVSARSAGVFTIALVTFLFTRELLYHQDAFLNQDGLSDSTMSAVMIAIALFTGGAATALYGTIVEKSLEQLQISSRETTYLANHDQLTGLPNRHAYYQKSAEFTDAHYQRGIVFYALDLNGFKAVNDTYGHFVGDEVLKIVADRLKALLGRYDWPARMGGDEFIVISALRSPMDNKFELASKILSKLSEPYEVGELSLNMSTSVGIAYSPDHGTDLETLATHADLALFAAKRKTNHRWHIFDTRLQEKAKRRRRVEERLRLALQHEALQVCYQPFVNNARGQVVGFEALARWHDEELGDVSPAEFIKVAENSGLVAEIGQFVLRAACKEAADWKVDAAAPVPRIAVNVSPHQFSSADFPAIVATVLEEYQLAPERLELEITETALMSDTKRAVKSLQALDKLGVSVSVDDFGTGYSSLSYLKLFPIDRLKIDRSFVRDIENDANDFAIVKAVVGLARSMELDVIAEGIETPKQADILRDMGCIEMQGYLYSRAIPASEVQTFLREFSSKHEFVVPRLQKLLTA